MEMMRPVGPTRTLACGASVAIQFLGLTHTTVVSPLATVLSTPTSWRHVFEAVSRAAVSAAARRCCAFSLGARQADISAAASVQTIAAARDTLIYLW